MLLVLKILINTIVHPGERSSAFSLNLRMYIIRHKIVNIYTHAHTDAYPCTHRQYTAFYLRFSVTPPVARVKNFVPKIYIQEDVSELFCEGPCYDY